MTVQQNINASFKISGPTTRILSLADKNGCKEIGSQMRDSKYSRQWTKNRHLCEF